MCQTHSSSNDDSSRSPIKDITLSAHFQLIRRQSCCSERKQMYSVDVNEVQTELSGLLARAVAGEDIVITREGEPVGTACPVREKPRCAKIRRNEWADCSVRQFLRASTGDRFGWVPVVAWRAHRPIFARYRRAQIHAGSEGLRTCARTRKERGLKRSVAGWQR